MRHLFLAVAAAAGILAGASSALAQCEDCGHHHGGHAAHNGPGHIMTYAANKAVTNPGTSADQWAYAHAANMPWHGSYYHTSYGTPVAMVLPPTAARSAAWGWGVTNTEVRPNYHQFGRGWPGAVTGGEGQFYPTPLWPSHTDQFGVYGVRAPW